LLSPHWLVRCWWCGPGRCRCGHVQGHGCRFGPPTDGLDLVIIRSQPREVWCHEEQEVRELFFERLQHLSAEAEYELRHPDYVMEMPQSGERIRGRDAMRAMQEAYPEHANPPTIQPRRVVGAGDVWVVEGASDYGGGQIFFVADIVEFRDGKILRETRYYAQPFEAPAWRAQWMEPMDDAAAPGTDAPPA
jgi:ketosteroid isomerase-like protein